jgi:hypothetical protein
LARHRNGETHRIPSWPINAIGAPELAELNERTLFVSSRSCEFRRKLLQFGHAPTHPAGRDMAALRSRGSAGKEFFKAIIAPTSAWVSLCSQRYNPQFHRQGTEWRQGSALAQLLPVL